MDRKNRVESVFNDLRADNLNILDDFYHENVKFQDPLGSINGLIPLKEYYRGLYKNVTDISFEFTDHIVENDSHVGIWTMRMKTKKLNNGKEMVLNGNSHIVFDPDTDKVIFHRDYFDMGEFIYEYIPVVGFAIKKIKQALGH